MKNAIIQELGRIVAYISIGVGMFAAIKPRPVGRAMGLIPSRNERCLLLVLRFWGVAFAFAAYTLLGTCEPCGSLLNRCNFTSLWPVRA